MSSDYLKLYHLNGRRVKVATGTWSEIKNTVIPPLRRGESFELVGFTGREHCKYASGSWDAIRVKMEGAGDYVRRRLEDDASATLLFVFGMTAWYALFCLVLGL